MFGSGKMVVLFLNQVEMEVGTLTGRDVSLRTILY